MSVGIGSNTSTSQNDKQLTSLSYLMHEPISPNIKANFLYLYSLSFLLVPPTIRVHFVILLCSLFFNGHDHHRAGIMCVVDHSQHCRDIAVVVC